MKRWQRLRAFLTPILDIYIAKHCFGTAEALGLAEAIKQHTQDIQVNLRVLDDMSAPVGAFISATPSYFLNGRLIFLGNPRLEELVASIRSTSANKGAHNE